LEFTIGLESDSDRAIASVAINLSTLSGIRLVNADTFLNDQVFHVKKGQNTVRLRINQLHLNPGIYKLALWVADPISAHTKNIAYDYIEAAAEVEVVHATPEAPGINPNSLVECDFELLKLPA
jgi:hypothetical protein